MKRETANVERLTEIVGILAAEFNIEPPRVQLGKRRVGSYFPFGRLIYFPTIGSWRGVEVTMLHEFTHHLHNMTVPFKERYRQRSHGPVFSELLHKVVAAWYGNADSYGWTTEYKSIQEWYKRKKGGPNANRRRKANSNRGPCHRGAPRVCPTCFGADSDGVGQAREVVSGGDSSLHQAHANQG